MNVDQFEDLSVRFLGYKLLTHWESRFQPVGTRERTHSTSSLPGVAFESVRLLRRFPNTLLAVYFRDVTRCDILFGWGIPFWRVLARRAQYPKGRNYLDDPEAYGDLLWVEFFETIDIISPEFPPTDRCNLSGVTWVSAGMGADLELIEAEDFNQAPWTGIDRGAPDGRVLPDISSLIQECESRNE